MFINLVASVLCDMTLAYSCFNPFPRYGRRVIGLYIFTWVRSFLPGLFRNTTLAALYSVGKYLSCILTWYTTSTQSEISSYVAFSSFTVSSSRSGTFPGLVSMYFSTNYSVTATGAERTGCGYAFCSVVGVLLGTVCSPLLSTWVLRSRSSFSYFVLAIFNPEARGPLASGGLGFP